MLAVVERNLNRLWYSTVTNVAGWGENWARVVARANRGADSRRLKFPRFWGKANESPEPMSSCDPAKPDCPPITRPSTICCSSALPACADTMPILKGRARESRGYFGRLIEYCGCFAIWAIQVLSPSTTKTILDGQPKHGVLPVVALVTRPWRPNRRGRRRGKQPDTDRLLWPSAGFVPGRPVIGASLVRERGFAVKNSPSDSLRAKLSESFVGEQMGFEVWIDVQPSDRDFQLNRLPDAIRPIFIGRLNSAKVSDCLFGQCHQHPLSELLRSSHSPKVSRFIIRLQTSIPNCHFSCLLLTFTAIDMIVQAAAPRGLSWRLGNT